MYGGWAMEDLGDTRVVDLDAWQAGGTAGAGGADGGEVGINVSPRRLVLLPALLVLASVLLVLVLR